MFEEKLKRVLNTGKINFGTKTVLNDIKNDKAKLVVISSNCPAQIKEDIEESAKLAEISVAVFGGTSIELGEFCGKPFLVAAISILDTGEVPAKELIKEAKQ